MITTITPPGKQAKRRHYGRWILEALVLILGIVWLVPLWAPIITSMKTVPEYFQGSQWTLPKDPVNFFNNVSTAWNTGGLGPGFFASLGAFAIVRLPIRAPFFWFFLVFTGTIVPFQMYLIPLFQTYNDVGLYDTWIGMALFYTAICIPFCLFVMRGAFSTISRELLEAARLDGCRDLDIYWRILMPLAKGSIAVLFLFQFTWTWNDLVFGLVLSVSDGVRPIMPALAGLQGIYSTQGPPTVLAAALIASLPTICVFLLLRNYVIRGLTLTVAT
jgi:ABC-type glycerol-3-phosphate transport system permease component